MHRASTSRDSGCPRRSCKGGCNPATTKTPDPRRRPHPAPKPNPAPDGEFARLRVSDTSRVVLVDLARDWRVHPPLRLGLGLVLHRGDAVSSKIGAMVGRGFPRDFIDVAATLGQYDRSTLLRLLFERDPGLGPSDVSLAMRQLDLLQDNDFAPYGLEPSAVAHLRHSLGSWPRSPVHDDEAARAYEATHTPPPG